VAVVNKEAVIKLVLGLIGSLLVGAVGFLLTLPTEVALTAARIDNLAAQVDDTLAVIDALHPRGSARAGGPVDEDAEVRDVKIRDLMKRAPPPVVLIEGPPPPCPPCPCECPEPEPTPEPTP